MLKCQIIGVGQCGNKATVLAVDENIVPVESTMLVNSTDRDFPIGYAGSKIIIGNVDDGGSGKEPNIGESKVLQSLQNGSFNIDKFIKADTDVVIIVTSTEGGSGSGAAPVIATYLRDTAKVNVLMFFFSGFEEDIRGMENTIRFFKNLPESISITGVSNKSYLASAKGNFVKAERLANEDFIIKLSILIGNNIRPSGRNIDPKDLYKTVIQTGFTCIEYFPITENVRSREMFADTLKRMISSSHSFYTNNVPDDQRPIVAAVINLPEDQLDYVDYNFSEVSDHFGRPFEKYMHIQSDNSINNFVSFICSGMEFPYEELEALYDRYREAKAKAPVAKQSIADRLSGMEFGDQSCRQYDLKAKDAASEPASTNTSTAERANFFAKYNMESPNNVGKNPAPNSKVKKDQTDGY